MSADWQPPMVETPRLRLRPLRESDAGAVFAYCSNPNMTHYTLWETHRTPADSAAFARDYARSRYREGLPEPLGVVVKPDPDDRVIGTVGCFWASRPNLTMELGYAIAESHWGHGYAAEASAALLDVVFARYSVHRVQARCVRENRRSGRVLLKLGMAFEGTQRAALIRRGRFWDLDYYSVLRPEWQSRPPTGTARVASLSSA